MRRLFAQDAVLDTQDLLVDIYSKQKFLQNVMLYVCLWNALYLMSSGYDFYPERL